MPRAIELLRWIAPSLLLFIAAPRIHAQVVTFSKFNDAVAGACYEPATTVPDSINPNKLLIGMGPCSASNPSSLTSPVVRMDTFSFQVAAPDGYFISKLIFSQNLGTSGSRGGRGFAAANWVVDDDPLPTQGTLDLSLEPVRKTVIPVSLTTFLAAFGISVVSGSASASNPTVTAELLPLP